MSRPLTLAATFLLVSASLGTAGDWPQILGPHRNGIADGERLLDAWPQGGPEIVWTKDTGDGFASVAVADGRAILFDRAGDRLRAMAVDAATGEQQWVRAFETDFQTGFTDDEGPRCTPVIVGEQVFLHGPKGRLWCLAMKDGSVVWERDTHEDFGASEGYFGAGSTPLVEGNLVLVNVGGRDEKAAVVAFDRHTGKTAWTAVADTASYSSPVAATIDGERHAIFVTRLKCVSLDPRTGTVRFEFDFGARGPTVNAATPVLIGERLFVTAHYRVGAVSGTISKQGFHEDWSRDDVLSSHYTTPIEHGGRLYGIHGQERLNPGALRCIDPATGKVQWSVDDFGYGLFVRANNRILGTTTTGDLVMFEANPEKYVELARSRVIGADSRVIPALANGLLYVRDRNSIRALRVGSVPE